MSEADWRKTLAEACTRLGSQKKVGDQIGYSAAVISLVLKNQYGENGHSGDLSAVEKAVKGAFMNLTVECPVYGDLPAHRCLEYQRMPFAATNPQRVQVYSACRSGCPNSRIDK